MSFGQNAILYSNAKPIIINRADVERLLARPGRKPRNQLTLELAASMGLRTGEIVEARIEWFDIDHGKCLVMDSKKRELFPVPLNYRVARLVAQVAEGREKGLLIRRFAGGRHIKKFYVHLEEPLTGDALWQITRTCARKAGIQNWREYTPRLLRHYFAASFAKGKDDKPGNIEVLRRILRHDSLLTTQFYLARLIFFEDIQEEYDRIHALPIERKEPSKPVNSTIALQCSECSARLTCKYQGDAIHSVWAISCKYHSPEKRIVMSP